MTIPDKIKNVIFDFDNTIAKINADWSIWYRKLGEIFREYEQDFDTNQNLKTIESYQNIFFKKYGPSIKKRVDASVIEFESNNIKGVTPIPQTIKLIEVLEDINLFVWSSNYSTTVKRLLDDLGILMKFKLIVGRDMVDYIKPEPAGFNKHFKNLGQKEEFIFVGDSKYDQGAAKNCGIEYLDVREI